MSRRIPPLNSLRTFEAVARTENLSAAARELHVTPSAVSKQLTLLESYLGVALCKRERYGISLTASGRDYALHIKASLHNIAQATDRLLHNASAEILTVRAYTSFAAKWLIPKLRSFRNACPNIEVQIDTGATDINFDNEVADIAIQSGSGAWPRLTSDFLFHDVIEPVCSPLFLDSMSISKKLPDLLARSCLLISERRQSDWDEWLRSTQQECVNKRTNSMKFATSVLTWQAAVDGLGLAMGQARLLKSEFVNNTLVRPFNRPVQRECGYYLVRPQLRSESVKVKLFRDWILTECSAEN